MSAERPTLMEFRESGKVMDWEEFVATFCIYCGKRNDEHRQISGFSGGFRIVECEKAPRW